MKKFKIFLIKTLFKEYYLMSVFKDKNNNLYGGTIHKDDNRAYVDHGLQDTKWIGKTFVIFI